MAQPSINVATSLQDPKNDDNNIAPSNIDLTNFHPKIKNLFKGKEHKLRMIDDWVLMETLGMGGYSKVKLGLHKQTGAKAALKIMFADQNGKMSQSKKKQLLRELNVMSKVNHPNVIKLISFNENAKYPEATGKYTPCIMTALEFASGGELFDYLMYTGNFDDVATRSYFKQLISGLEAMHNAGIAHRDLKPENLLMDSEFTLKIADFGFATEFKDSKGKIKLMKTACGTKNYLAPEFWKGLKYSYKCDIFACGIILFTTYAGFPPFMEAQPNDWWWDKYSIAIDKLKRATYLRKVIKKTQLQHPNKKCVDENKEMESCLNDARRRMTLFWKAHQKKRKFDDDDFKDIALNLIHPNPDQRMNINQIKQHRWFANKPIYSANELKMYLTRRVKTVLQGRARKIRKLMQEQQMKRLKYTKRPLVVDNTVPLTPLQSRAKEIDPNDYFVKNVNYVGDDVFLESMYQFFTFSPPNEMAARIEKAAVKFGSSINISPKDNLITIEAKLLTKRLMANNQKKAIEENVMFIVKQFLLDNKYDNNRLELLNRYDQKYLVSFKRLRGTFESYCKIAEMFYCFPNIAQAMTFDDLDMDDNITTSAASASAVSTATTVASNATGNDDDNKDANK